MRMINQKKMTKKRIRLSQRQDVNNQPSSSQGGEGTEEVNRTATQINNNYMVLDYPPNMQTPQVLPRDGESSSYVLTTALINDPSAQQLLTAVAGD